MSRVAAFVGRQPAAGVPVGEIRTAFPDCDVYNCLSVLVRTGRIIRLRRGVYAPNPYPVPDRGPEGVKPVTVRTTLTTFGMVVQSFVDQGRVPLNPVKLVDRPPDDLDDEDDDGGGK